MAIQKQPFAHVADRLPFFVLDKVAGWDTTLQPFEHFEGTAYDIGIDVLELERIRSYNVGAEHEN